jgi:nicotinic acid phosphoribosyltransferase
MPTTAELYKTSLALLTDLYQVTMAYGYWKLGRMDQEAVFHLTYRVQHRVRAALRRRLPGEPAVRRWGRRVP